VFKFRAVLRIRNRQTLIRGLPIFFWPFTFSRRHAMLIIEKSKSKFGGTWYGK